MKKRNKHDGISLEDLLKEEGLYEVCAVAAIKELIAEQIKATLNAGEGGRSSEERWL